MLRDNLVHLEPWYYSLLDILPHRIDKRISVSGLDRISGYPVEQMIGTFLEPFQCVQNKSEIATRNVGGFCKKLKISQFFFSWKKISLFTIYRQKYWPDIRPNQYPVIPNPGLPY